MGASVLRGWGCWGSECRSRRPGSRDCSVSVGCHLTSLSCTWRTFYGVNSLGMPVVGPACLPQAFSQRIFHSMDPLSTVLSVEGRTQMVPSSARSRPGDVEGASRAAGPLGALSFTTFPLHRRKWKWICLSPLLAFLGGNAFCPYSFHIAN